MNVPAAAFQGHQVEVEVTDPAAAMNRRDVRLIVRFRGFVVSADRNGYVITAPNATALASVDTTARQTVYGTAMREAVEAAPLTNLQAALLRLPKG